jgi:hypothetical protein
VPLQRQLHFRPRHAAAIVHHLDAVDPAARKADLDPSRAASIAFSTSSFSALAGRSTTSPAAIRLIKWSGSRRIDMRQAL